ncbi:class I SAM-dependent rRNA methyltransferase [Siphonobacter sp.]|uniref:class I SAM-dependent rRNA methyltransferase n=1 Tax=Siphonobacter sp. TaxID=1869184 RepID=UPI003B3A95D6
MESVVQIILKPGKDAPVRRFHPWVFSGAIAKTLGKPKDGEVVEVLDHQKNYLATGHYHEGSITVKLFSFEPLTPDADFWLQKLENALRVRQALQFTTTTCYRLVHGEGDGFPGLILDWYNGVVVFQAHSVGMHREREAIAQALQKLYGDALKGIYDKSHETLPDRYAQSVQNGYLWQKDTITLPHPVLENGHTFLIDWQTGQKTGFFLDQRENRQLLTKYVKGKRVLNAFCYSGGFSIYALAAEASLVHSVDVSEKAIKLVEANVEANNFGPEPTHASYAEDVVKYLKTHDQQYDVVVLDPPAYAKSMDARHRAVQGYKRLNIEGLKRLAPGGILFTFSCSQVVDRELFYNTIVAAAIEAGRQVRVLHHLSQGPDHPVNFFHPEGHYLKGLVLYVE